MPYDYNFSHHASAFDDSCVYGPSEAEYPTANAANFYYSASGAPGGEYTGAHGGFAQAPYNSGPSSAEPSTAGGLANGMADNEGTEVSTFMEAPLLHPPLYGAGVPAFQNDKLDYGQTDSTFDHFCYASSPEDTSSSSSTSGDKSNVGSYPEAQGPAFGMAQSFRTLFHESYLQTPPRGFDALASSVSGPYFTAGSQDQPASTSMMPSSAPAYADAHSGNSIHLGINFFTAPTNSLATLPPSGASNRHPPDMSLDSCRDLHMIVNRTITQETMHAERPTGAVYPNVRRDAVLAESNAFWRWR